MSIVTTESSRSAVIEGGIGFPGGLSVAVREVDDTTWTLLDAFEYRGTHESFSVPAGEPSARGTDTAAAGPEICRGCFP